MRHTPRPLEMTRHATPDDAPQCGIYAEGSQHDFAIVGGDNAEADASLFIAAPDLLESLKDMVDMFERHITGKPGPDDAAERWDRARDAITKATQGAQSHANPET